MDLDTICKDMNIPDVTTLRVEGSANETPVQEKLARLGEILTEMGRTTKLC